MLDQIPTRAWLVLVIGLIAIVPARYVYRHFASSPRYRDITQPPEDLEWRTEPKLYLNLLVLSALAALTAFIFTPAAEAFARSPQFAPLLTGLSALFALWTVIRGLQTGTIEPFSRGASSEVRRDTQPRRFWASIGWNSLIGSGLLWLTFSLFSRADRDLCLNTDEQVLPTDRIAGCDSALKDTSLTALERSEIFTFRAWNRDTAGDKKGALADYGRSLALDNTDPTAFYYRGMIHEALGREQLANEDYNSAILLDPADARTRLARGVLYLNNGNLPGALKDLERADALKPGDVWILANRGVTKAWLKDLRGARGDLDAARAIDPSNEVVAAGDAIVSLQEDDLPGAVRRLDDLLKVNPGNSWARDLRDDIRARLARSPRGVSASDW